MPFKPVVNYNHHQQTASLNWDISHGMDCYPAVDVYINMDGSLTKIIPNGITLIDKNTLRISFSEEQAGVARLV